MLNKEYLLQGSIAILDFLKEQAQIDKWEDTRSDKEKIMNEILKKHHFGLSSFTDYVSRMRNIDYKEYNNIKQFYTQVIRELKIELYEME